MDLHEYAFSSAQIAKAADMTPPNFRAQLTRGNWRILGKERGANGDGHQFTIYDALSYALARRLAEHGVPASEAFDLAVQDFAHTGDERRDPGGIFDTDTLGRTLYVYSHGTRTGRCVASSEITDPVELLFPDGYNRAAAAIIIDLTELRDRVFNALGLDSRDYE